MQLSNLCWPAVQSLSKDIPVVIPIAAVEQHGHHLPLITDSMLLGEIVQRAERELSDSVLVTPLQWYGNSHHHLDYPGTLSCPPRTYLDLVAATVDNMVAHGFKRILVLNGHGGNDVPGKQALFELRQQYRSRQDLLLLFATYWSLAPNVAEEVAGLFQQEMAHACEWETSMMLCIAPDLVGDYLAAEPVEPGNAFRPASRAWITQDRSTTGHIGWPHLATQSKGEQLLQQFSAGVIGMVHRIRNWDGSAWEG
ncbi:MAG: creatininase family protein [Planctomycetales bacterium]|nr:creatininase family protein [Planctomycetales bacterium]